MQLQTQLLKQLSPVFDMARDGLHLDFHRQKLFMAGPGFHGVVDLSSSLDSASEDYICIPDTSYFLGPVSAYPTLEWKNSSFCNGKNRFRIPFKPSDFKQVLETQLLEALNPPEPWQAIPLREDIIDALKTAKNFALPSYGVVFSKVGILGTDSKKAYAYGPLDGIDVPECSFPLSFIPILNIPNTEFTAYVKWDSEQVNHMILVLKEIGKVDAYAAFKFEFSLAFQGALGSQTPFLREYSQSLLFDMADVKNCLQLAKPIVKAFDQLPMDCSFDPETNTLTVGLVHAEGGVDYRFHLKIIESTLTTPQKFRMFFANFEKAMTVWTSDSAKQVRMSFYFKEGNTPAPILRFSSNGEDKQMVVLTQLRIGDR